MLDQKRRSPYCGGAEGMSDLYQQLREAERKRAAVERELNSVRVKIEEAEYAFRKALPVGEGQPCSVGVLPSGQIVVHVWVEKSSEPNQLHIVFPGFIDERGRPRRKYTKEQLGEGIEKGEPE